MLRCDEVTRLCASEEILTAPLMKRLSVRMHLFLCRHCRRYVRELARIREAARSLVDTPETEAESSEALVRRVLGDHGSPID